MATPEGSRGGKVCLSCLAMMNHVSWCLEEEEERVSCLTAMMGSVVEDDDDFDFDGGICVG